MKKLYFVKGNLYYFNTNNTNIKNKFEGLIEFEFMPTNLVSLNQQYKDLKWQILKDFELYKPVEQNISQWIDCVEIETINMILEHNNE